MVSFESLLRSMAALALACAPFAGRPAAQLLAYDGFDGGPAPDLAGSTGGAGWTSAWADTGTHPTEIARAGLEYAGLASLPGAAATPVAFDVWPSSIYARAFAAPPVGATELYVSFLMRDDAAFGMWGGLSFGQYPSKMHVGSPPGYYVYGLMTAEGLGDLSSKPLVQGETTLVVVRISKNVPGAGLTYRLYVDPTVGSPEPSFPDAIYSLGVAALPVSVQIDNGTGFTTDELRVGTTWPSVLPAPTWTWTDLGFAKPGVTGAPHLAGAGPLSAGTSNSVTLTNAAPASHAWLAVGANVWNLPLLGGVLVPEPSLVIGQTTSPAGAASVPFVWPSGIPAGAPIVFQYWIQDAAAASGFSASNGLQGFGQ